LIAFGYFLHYLFKKKDSEVARKILHIWVGNWFFIYKYLFETPHMAMLGLLGFAALNLFLEIRRFHSRRYGTIYYPLAVTLLLILTVRGTGNITAVGCGIMVMAYGDGLAAIVGSKTHSRRMSFLLNKTVNGSITMFVVSTIILLLFGCPFVYALLIGFIAALIEAYSPLGLDNIFVPVIVFYLVAHLC